MLKIDLYPSQTKEEIAYAIGIRKKNNSNPRYYLDGICHPKMIDYLIDNKILEPSLVASTLKCFTLNVIDTYDACDAQVIRGGISLQEIDYNLKLKNILIFMFWGKLWILMVNVEVIICFMHLHVES